MPSMTQQELEEFLHQPLIVSFTTIRPNGSPHTTPIWYEYDAGKFYCIAEANTVKARNLRRDPRVALCIATHDEPYKYVVAEGTCVIDRDGVAQRSNSISTRYYGETRGKQFAQELLEAANTVVLVVTPTRLLSESAA